VCWTNKSASQTEGIKYAGSKRTIIPSILRVAERLGVQSVLDGFSGTTRVSQAFAKAGYDVWSNDISEWSLVFGRCYLLNSREAGYYAPMLEHLNSLPGQNGWFTENYGGNGAAPHSDSADGKKKIWQIHNTLKLDAIRPEIDRITSDEVERAVLLSSLILAMDKVDSTVGHHASYLRQWAPRAFNTMKMEIPKLIDNSGKTHRVTKLDIFEALKGEPPITSSADLLYFDPPYGSANEKMPPSRVRYASYYHLWTTIIRNDNPAIVGAANRRADVSDKMSGSVFEEFRRSDSGRFIAVEAIDKMLRVAKAPYIVLSYNNQGRATLAELLEVCRSSSKDMVVISQDHKSNVMKTMRWTNQWIREQDEATKEYLFVLSQDEKLPDFKRHS
jgi:adenine-specific DNA-methyltransferase